MFRVSGFRGLGSDTIQYTLCYTCLRSISTPFGLTTSVLGNLIAAAQHARVEEILLVLSCLRLMRAKV